MGPTISSLIRHDECGDGVAADELFSTLYLVLRWMAKQELARRGSPASLSVTRQLLSRSATVHGVCRTTDAWRLIIDHARSRNAIERGGEFEITSLESDSAENPVDAKELSSSSDALDQLARVESKLAELVDMKFFRGFSFAEIAALENLSERTVQRRW